MPNIRVLLADDHTIVRKGLCALLEEETDISVIGEAEDGREAVEKAFTLEPDVVVIDIGMPSLNGLEAVKAIKKGRPEMKVLILTMHENEEYITEALRAGVSGYLIKKSVPRDLITAIQLAYKGESFLSPSISTKVINRFIRQNTPSDSEFIDSEITLTTREREVVQLIAEGLTNKEIASNLGISIKTVKNHRSNLMEKLDLHNTAEITQFAIKNGLIILDK
ncbi:MAG: response regulator transcription factor [Deltaproteobacteria bacterium]|jgi:DNA-binding NarL/FixJ family response regulator|nr:response regulator transcription factor [Deltaproteobacteria bacterium]MBT6505142.1 response regulator transcription factor [Deltaproteobacteria bacterium]MBT7154102.1 response regulator transcription factor [Deltaproteobacteria bacterium]